MQTNANRERVVSGMRTFVEKPVFWRILSPFLPFCRQVNKCRFEAQKCYGVGLTGYVNKVVILGIFSQLQKVQNMLQIASLRFAFYKYMGSLGQGFRNVSVGQPSYGCMAR